MACIRDYNTAIKTHQRVQISLDIKYLGYGQAKHHRQIYMLSMSGQPNTIHKGYPITQYGAGTTKN